ncbi:flagella synthesis protein FlgN [Thalassotalea atypica]|uniref:flagella synthesis protein FlgN n=1 Tax=Thalassotalea atypica TaxID=2054316 RepID=UPI0025736F4E|nr:flagellar protein FlgN [Thalassotalea atypica]
MSDQGTSNPLLEEQFNLLSQLEKLLVQEKEVLQQRDSEALIALSQVKEQLLADIQTNDQTIATSQVFIQQKNSGQLSERLNDVESCLQRCKELNEVNGQIVAHSQVAIERMKSALLESRDKSSMTYDSKGKKHAGLSSLGIKA